MMPSNVAGVAGVAFRDRSRQGSQWSTLNFVKTPQKWRKMVDGFYDLLCCNHTTGEYALVNSSYYIRNAYFIYY